MINKFPNITHINDVLPAIEGRKEFKHGMNSPHFDMVAYYIQASDTFTPDDPKVAALRRECRGFLFHKDGSVARRAFHKFFNLGEANETMPENIDLSKPHIILEKLDGSMVAPFISKLDNEVYWASMRGSWDYHNRLKSLFSKTAYETLVRETDKDDLTVIMEFCAPDNRIVVEYDAPNMTLLAIRNRSTGAYLPRSEIVEWGQKTQVPVVQPYVFDYENLSTLTSHVRAVEGMEGIVLYFDDGLLVKLKGEWYSQLHKLLSCFDFEKDIARLILSNNQDDLLGILSTPRKAELISYQDTLLEGLAVTAEKCESLAANITKQDMSRKDFAQSDLSPSPVIKAIIFKNFDNFSDANFINDLMATGIKNTITGTRWDEFKFQAGLSLNWDPEIE